MKSLWPRLLAAFSRGAKRKWLLSAFYCALLSSSYLIDLINPEVKRIFCQSYTPGSTRNQQSPDSVEK
jgi:hypothetical protein